MPRVRREVKRSEMIFQSWEIAVCVSKHILPEISNYHADLAFPIRI